MILVLSSFHNRLSPGPSIYSFLQEYSAASLVEMEDREFMDRDRIGELLREYRPKVVLNCLEYSDIDSAEYERESAYAVNGTALKNLSCGCLERDMLLVHLSTSYVFNGSSGIPYREEDRPDPATVYGDSKHLGEQVIAESGCRHLIMRTPDLFGERIAFFSPRLVSMEGDSIVNVIRDQVIAPACSSDLAKAISELISRGCEGTYHFCQEGPVMTGDFFSRATELFSRYGVTDKKYSIKLVEKDDFLAPGDRPGYNVLDSGKLTETTGRSARSWESALEDYIAAGRNAIILT